MKHILSILVVALAFTATTAFAAFTYEIIKTGYDQYHTPQDNDYRDSFYKIRITSGTGDIWFSDWIDNVGDSHQEDNLSLKNIEYYGYRYLDSNNESKIGTYEYKKMSDVKETSDYYGDDPVKSPWNDHQIVRYSYKLGTFTEGDEVEIYMKDINGGESWSNTTKYMGAYKKNTNVDELEKYKLGFYDEGVDWNAQQAIVAAAMKAMPLAELDTGNGHRVFFTINGAASGNDFSGAPLPGGLAISLIAGVFALGYWFVRRRNAAAV